jgi:DNA-binding winged helix-turn-helix (wHTH) protein/tetratricopeptide (TPR) repeat protein
MGVMPMSSPGTLRFGEFEVDPANNVLTRDGIVVKLAPQPFKVLVLLVTRRGTLITREALRQAVWGEDTVVDFEHGLNTCIRHIRVALGDDAESPRFIETVPRLGYRFTAAVTSVAEQKSHTRRRPVVAAGAAVTIAVVGLLITLGVALRTSARSASIRPQVRELYLRGRIALDDPTIGSARTALQLFEKAIAIDPSYAPAQAGVAEAYLRKPSSLTGVPPDVAIARAEHAIAQSLALDDSLSEAHLAAAELRMTRHDWPVAGREYRRAVALAPKNSIARQQYAMWLSYQGRFDEALNEARLGESLDPLSPPARNTVAEVLRHARRFDEAIAQAHRVLELNPNFGRAHAVLGHCYLAQGRFEPAIEEHRRSGNTGGNLGSAYALAGFTKEAREIVDALQKRYASTGGGPGEIAQGYIGLGEFDRAFEWLSRAVEDGSVWTLKVAVVWDPLRADPRFEQLLRRAGY